MYVPSPRYSKNQLDLHVDGGNTCESEISKPSDVVWMDRDIYPDGSRFSEHAVRRNAFSYLPSPSPQGSWTTLFSWMNFRLLTIFTS